jgi:hypothetical protein
MEDDSMENMPTELDSGMNLPPTDTPSELTKFVLDPEARQLYTHITKDLATTNLNENEIAYIDINLRLLHMVIYVEQKLGELDDIKKVILQDINGYLQVTRSKGGFERLAEISKHLTSSQKYEEKKDRKGWI